RDCLEHGNMTGVVVLDFEPESDGTLAPPTIAIDFRKSRQQRCTISVFMKDIERMLLDCFEMVIMHACAKHAQPFAGVPMVVAPLDDNYRRAWHVRFGYGMYYEDGRFAPCG